MTQNITETITSLPKLHGLVLAGGRSKRMGQDKAVMVYHENESQVERCIRLLRPFCQDVFLSIRHGQNFDITTTNVSKIHDRYGEIGPLGGILSAFYEKPDFAWMVVACDLPFIDEETLENLITNRRIGQPFVAYQSSHDGFPEPLCAIYEPMGKPLLQEHFLKKIFCPRKILINAKIPLLQQGKNYSLDNANSPDDYHGFLKKISLTNEH